MKISKFSVLGLLLALTLVLAACPAPAPAPAGGGDMADGCDDAIGCVDIAAGDPIKMASALVITGPNESLGLDSQYGVEIAIADRGEIMGHPITLQAEDDGCSAEGGQTAGQKIVSDPSIVAVVGTSCSGAGVPHVADCLRCWHCNGLAIEHGTSFDCSRDAPSMLLPHRP